MLVEVAEGRWWWEGRREAVGLDGEPLIGLDCEPSLHGLDLSMSRRRSLSLPSSYSIDAAIFKVVQPEAVGDGLRLLDIDDPTPKPSPSSSYSIAASRS